ncbi:hypothetical protein [Gracilibacillus oryzae]|nr:hypothetical protein [Gracilibacillus oryzae]
MLKRSAQTIYIQAMSVYIIICIAAGNLDYLDVILAIIFQYDF